MDLSNYPEAPRVDSEALLKPFAPQEVERVMKRAKKDSAAGPNKIDLKKFIAVDRDGKALTNFFNT